MQWSYCKKNLVNKHQYTGHIWSAIRIDKAFIDAPFARIIIDTPYYKGEAEALCLSDSIFELVISNISWGSRFKLNLFGLDHYQRTKKVTPITCSKTFNLDSKIDLKQLVKLQAEDISLNDIQKIVIRSIIHIIIRSLFVKREYYIKLNATERSGLINWSYLRSWGQIWYTPHMTPYWVCI